MKVEHFKSFILVVLIITSGVLSYSLWIGVRQYEALPAWFTEVPSSSRVDDENIITGTIGDVELLSAVLKPERLVKHRLPRHTLYWLTSNPYSNEVWNTANSIIEQKHSYSLESITAEYWNQATKRTSYEFLFAGSYPLELLYPLWSQIDTAIKPHLERMLITADEAPELLIRSTEHNQYYRVILNDLQWELIDFSSIKAGSENNGWLVYDAGVANDDIASGVYLPLNFVNRYKDLFPEVLVTANTHDQDQWLPLYFTNTSLAREIALSNNKFHYTLGSVSLSLAYNFAPHVEYSYTQLDQQEISDISCLTAVSTSSNFIAEHNPTAWPKFNSSVRLTKVEQGSSTNKYEIVYGSYITNIAVNVPIESIHPAFYVNSENGIVTRMKRQIWNFGRFNYLPKINIDAPEAIIRLSSDRYKIATEANPNVSDVISSFQNYLEAGFQVSDVYIAYYTDQKISDSLFVSPHWAITLTDGNGSLARFYINAMTGHIPNANSFVIDE